MFTIFKLKWNPDRSVSEVVSRETRGVIGAARILAAVWTNDGRFSAQIESGDIAECPAVATEGWTNGQKRF